MIDQNVKRTPREQRVHLENIRAELRSLGWEMVSIEWLKRFEEAVDNIKTAMLEDL